MITDYSANVICDPSVIVYPDWTFVNEPLPPDQLLNRVFLTGSEANPPGIVLGTLDSPEN